VIYHGAAAPIIDFAYYRITSASCYCRHYCCVEAGTVVRGSRTHCLGDSLGTTAAAAAAAEATWRLRWGAG